MRQYRSGIYYQTPEQKAMAEASMSAYQVRCTLAPRACPHVLRVCGPTCCYVAVTFPCLQAALSQKGFGKITTEVRKRSCINMQVVQAMHAV